MSKTFTSTYDATQILVNPVTDNPATVATGGVISVNSTSTYAAGIFGSSGFAWTVANFGIVSSVGSNGVGIDLSSGGDVTNGQSGVTGELISGAGIGVRIQGGMGTLNPSQNFSGDTFQVSADAGAGTLVTEVCFCRGTRVLTERGEVAVEDLAIGDRVKTLSGALKPIRWIGFGRDLVSRANRLPCPVVVCRGALADDLPRRDLYLTHGHALHFDGVLIPVENLINHRSIRWDDTARVVEYYHIELDDHDVLFAEGAPAESYYDAGNRALFQNVRPGSKDASARPTFAPVLTAGEVVGKVWAALFERAGGRIEHETTDDPDLHLVVDGERLDPASAAGGVYSFRLAAPPTGALCLRSRSFVPSLIRAGAHDHRRLGVAIQQIIVQRPGLMTSFAPDAPMFIEGGCHPPEGGYCWTDGDFRMPASLFAHLMGDFRLIVHTRAKDARYPVAAAVAASR